ncbi:hypothetical protein TRFO_11244 [Tritrichomonas foetus]|uniref:VPS9 domain-containing protein n=1 Tax=Tritrichomonas foetus TaxID=1144522 RepID=A0A1J4J499_9EUKA|nr:hypothetical protein TRFO_11244 [Tritrichomonas foetus]|eukprot:OHS94186.1 hypothetical protein TRFO_11244 [Tritrichomonas foetus]
MEYTFLNIHQQLIQKKQLDSLLRHELERQRQAIDTSVRKIISDLRSYSLLDVWYPKLTESCVMKFLTSSIYKRENRQVFESPTKLPFPTNKTLRLNNFLKYIPDHLDIILKCIHQYFQSSIKSEEINYIPTETTISFFASSTFPALFGYNWCIEEGKNYIDALLKLIEMTFNQYGKSFLNSNFRNSYLRELIRQFFHASGIQRFLQLSLSTDIALLLADERLNRVDEGTIAYIEILLIYVERINRAFISSMPKMPPLIKHFFSESFRFACENCPKDSMEPYQLIEFLFFDLMISPALLNPKLFALIPETSISTRSPHLTMLTKIFRWKLLPIAIPDKYKAIQNNKNYNSINVFYIIKQLTSFKDDLEGIYGNMIMEVTDTQHHLILMSANDVQFLAHIINETLDKVSCKDSTKEKIRGYAKIETELNLENDELLDFWYSSYRELPVIDRENDAIELVIPIVGQHEPVSIDPKISKTISHLINYLQGIQPNMAEPVGLYQFLQNQRELAEKNMSSEWITKTEAIESKLQRLNMPEEEVLEAVRATITERLDNSASEFATSFKHQECLDDLKRMSKSISKLNEQLLPIIHQSVLRVFFNSHKDIHDFLKKHTSSLSSNNQQWVEFFKPITQNLQEYGESLNLDANHQMRLVRQLHSALVSEIPFKEFQESNQNCQQLDEKLNSAYKGIIENFKEDKYSKTLMQLFTSPGCFESAIEVLRNGTKYGAPLEKLAKINESMVILQDIYLFEAGEGCPGDDFLPMFIFALLNARLPSLASMKLYIEHFLISVSEKIKILDSKEKYVMTTFMSAAEHILSFVSSQ